MRGRAKLHAVFSHQKVRYIVSGSSSFALEYGLFALLNAIKLDLFVANTISFLAGLIFSFYLHKKWSFSGEHHYNSKKQATAYTVLALCNLVLTNVLIGLFVKSFHITPMVAKLFCIVAIVIWNYIIMNKFIFKRKMI